MDFSIGNIKKCQVEIAYKALGKVCLFLTLIFIILLFEVLDIFFFYFFFFNKKSLVAILEYKSFIFNSLIITILEITHNGVRTLILPTKEIRQCRGTTWLLSQQIYIIKIKR